MILEGKRVLITGGTGSLGRVLLRRLLEGDAGKPAKIRVLSRDEAKQHELRIQYSHRGHATDEVIYDDFRQRLEFHIGDIRDISSVASALRDIDVVFNAAALKQVPTCEYFPTEAVRTNILGPENIVRAIREFELPVATVVGVSTDKAVKPVNVMGMTKAIQERVFVRANLDVASTRFVVVRYGNVLASRGSVIPLFHDQIHNGGPVTITTETMTRFLLSLHDAVDVIFAAVESAAPGQTFIPRARSARVVDIASALIGDRPIRTEVTGIRPGEKVHEILVSEEEAPRTYSAGAHLAIDPMLPELAVSADGRGEPFGREYSSADDLMTRDEVESLLRERSLMVDDGLRVEGETLR